MTTLNLQVAASSDDAFESAAAAVTLNGLTIPLAAAGQWGGGGRPSYLHLKQRIHRQRAQPQAR